MNVLQETKTVCSQCNKVVPAVVRDCDGQVFFVQQCPVHGERETLISSDLGWYTKAMEFAPSLVARGGTRPVEQGCPFDCGLCVEHQQRMFMPVVAITSACNLACPICYTINNNRQPFHMSRTEFGRILERIRENDPGMQIINFTGGEPTVHPEFCDLVEMCRDAGIRRITISTNGLRFIEAPDMLRRLADLDARIVLSFNSFRSEPYKLTAGADLLDRKLKVLDLLEEIRPSASLLAVVAAGINEDEIGEIARYVIEQDHLVSLEIHSVTFTGQTAGRFDRAARVTVPDIISDICRVNPQINMASFLPSPCAHPLCYSTCYLLKTADGAAPFSRFIPDSQMRELLTGNLYVEPGPKTEEILMNAVNNLWADADPGNDGILQSLRAMLKQMFPMKPITYAERQRVSEQATKAIYIHSHMDEDNFDLERIAQCPVLVPSADGSIVPVCSYNNFYRAQDPRFCQEI